MGDHALLEIGFQELSI